MGPVSFTYTAEIFPLEHRIIGMSLGMSVNFLGAGILAFFVPIIPTGSILLGIFAGLNILAFIAIWKLVPETIGAAADNETHMTALDLSQLFYIFKRPNSSHQMYMSEVYFGYFWDSIWKILTFQDFKAPEPFYQWNLHLDRRNPSKSS
jgi:MFS family permease